MKGNFIAKEHFLKISLIFINKNNDGNSNIDKKQNQNASRRAIFFKKMYVLSDDMKNVA